MGILSRGGEEKDGEERSGQPGLDLDLEVRYCETCRRELRPWLDTCPDDGGRALRAAELPSREQDLGAGLRDDTGT